MESSPSCLIAVTLFLFAAVAAVPIAQRLGIGPWDLGLIRDVDEILYFSELWVVFLMFIISLELNSAKLWHLRHSISSVGAAQVAITAAVLGLFLPTPARWSRGARCCNRWVCIRISPTRRSNTFAGWICVCCVN